MASPRTVTAAFVAAALVIAIGAQPSLAAFQNVQVSPASGPVGIQVTMHAEMSHRWRGTNPGTLVLVGQAALTAEPSASHCEEIPGALEVAAMTWEAAAIEFQGLPYEGYVGDATFTVPEVPTGTYYLAESIDATGTGCHVFASFEVTAGLPNTAMSCGPRPALVAPTSHGSFRRTR